MTDVVVFLVPLLASWLMSAVLIQWAPRLGLVDLPGARKVHTTPTPRGGGLAIYAALLFTVAVLPETRTGELLTVLGLGGVIVVLGLVDDLRPLPWQLRLGVQAGAACLLVWTWPEEPSWPEEHRWAMKAAAVFWIVGLVNAFNMLDNMDTLSASVAGIACLGFAVLSRWEILDLGPAAPFLMLAGALVGFLWFNWPPAGIFMGDAGSTLLGFFLGAMSFRPTFRAPEEPRAWLVPLCVLAVPWYDMTTVVALRLWQRRSPFHADKQHLSHRLAALTNPRRAVAIIRLLALFSVLMAVALGRGERLWPAYVLAGVWLGVAAVEYVRYFRKPRPT